MNTTRCLSNDVAVFATRKSLSTLPRCSDPGAVPAEAIAAGLFPRLVARKAPRARCATLQSIALDASIAALRETIAWRNARRAV